jgi:hypothetical protein
MATNKLRELMELVDALAGQTPEQILAGIPLAETLKIDGSIVIAVDDLERQFKNVTEDSVGDAQARGIALGIRFAYEMEKEVKAQAAGNTERKFLTEHKFHTRARGADGATAYQAVMNDRGKLSAAARFEFPDGIKWFDLTILKNGTETIGHAEFPDGSKWFDVTLLADTTVKVIDRTEKIGRAEFPDGSNFFDVTIHPDKSVTGRTSKHGKLVTLQAAATAAGV